MDKPIRLKRYANRRLYNTRDSAYMTLTQVAGRIKQGEQFEVVEARSGEDVTAYTLTQVLLEEARAKNFLLPAPLLHLMIQYGDNLLGEFFEKHLDQVIRNYLAYKGSVDEQFRQWMEMGMGLVETPAKTFSDLLAQIQAKTSSVFQNTGAGNENKSENGDKE
ncbi:MAG: polyhydroxyalkanoate synthesis regulator DNA-binding domain-containing protein [Thermodesulfobacteriota bacterium]